MGESNHRDQGSSVELQQASDRLLYRWLTREERKEKGELRYLSQNVGEVKVLLVQGQVSYLMFLFHKREQPPLQIEGEASDLKRIIDEELQDGWSVIGGKQIESLEYFFPEEILR